MHTRFIGAVTMLAMCASATLGWAQTEQAKPSAQDTLTLIFTNQGHTSTAKNPGNWPYPPQGESGDHAANFSQADLAKLISNDAAMADTFLKNFEPSADSISGAMRFTPNGKTLIVAGTVTIHATEGGGKGNRNIEASLKGTITLNDENKVVGLSIAGENVKVTGTWDAGEWGKQELTGEGTLLIQIKGQETAKKSTGTTGQGPGATAGGGNSGPGNVQTGPQEGWEVTTFEPMIGIKVSEWKTALNLNDEQVAKLKELIKTAWGKWGVTDIATLRKEVADEFKKNLTEEQKAKVDELLKKNAPTSFGPSGDPGQPGGTGGQKDGSTNNKTKGNQQGNQNGNQKDNKNDGQGQNPK